MQFTYPNLLWALLLLLIPIIVHLLQLRRFKKTPFTNVKLLQKVVAKSRKSQTLKKYLLLTSRLLLLAALVLAFAQPFIAAEEERRKRELVVYLDNSFSMQAPGQNGTLLSTAIQEFLETIPEESQFSLLTNDAVFAKTTVKAVQQPLLQMGYTTRQLNLEEILFKARSIFDADTTIGKDLLLISDFQQRMTDVNITAPADVLISAVNMKPDGLINTAIDSAILKPLGTNSMELTVLLSSNSESGIPVSLYNGSRLIAKIGAQFEDSENTSLTFTLSKEEELLGRVAITDNGLDYDNNLYVTINSAQKAKVLAINEAPGDFLERVYTEDEFELESTTPGQLNYGRIESKNLIVLNQLSTIPGSLRNALRSFQDQGGSLLIIPGKNIDMAAYNSFLANWGNSRITGLQESIAKVTDIAFNHPLYDNVFEKRVTNFQYPSINSRYTVNSNLPPILNFQNGEPFLLGGRGRYLFTGALDASNSNFKGSPLIVPTLYGIGKQSLALPQPYYSLGTQVTVDVPVAISGDQILKIVQEGYEFIPRQQAFSNKASLFFSEPPDRDGIFAIINKADTLQYLSINYPRDESALLYNFPDWLSSATSIPSVFERIENQGRITPLWKWFAILAVVFILSEVLIQKLLP